jgi:hypothetical protein
VGVITMTSKMNLPAAFFRQTTNNNYEPSEAVIGPWSPELQHGGPPCALLTHALRTYPMTGVFQLARITIEFLGPVPVKPCEIRIEKVRGGKQIELLRGEYLSGGKVFLLAHAWRLKTESGITEAVDDSFELPDLPGPQAQRFFPGHPNFPYGDAMEWRFTEGGFDSLGPATVWTRARIPLIEGQETDGVEALILMIDSANGVSNELDILKWTFVPVDLTVGLYRHPIGPWVGMSAHTTLGIEGIGQTTTIAFDAMGKVGQSIHTLFVRPRSL